MFKFFVIHNLEKDRYDNLIKNFNEYGVNLEDVTFINHPNKNELTFEIKKIAVQKNLKSEMVGSVVVTNIT